jgi:hypothetical protein
VPSPVTEASADPEPEAPGDDFDYLFNDPVHDTAQQDDADDGPPADIVWEDAHPVVPDLIDDGFVAYDDDHFDAFNANTWNFKAPAPPWYRSQGAVTAIVAVTVAVVALVVSVVLLVVRVPSDADETPVTDTSSAPTTAATTPEATSELPPPPPPPAPPPSEVAPPPVYNRPRSEPRPTKEPEIGVTRTPVTRSPLSVAPQPRPGSQHR